MPRNTGFYGPFDFPGKASVLRDPKGSIQVIFRVDPAYAQTSTIKMTARPGSFTEDRLADILFMLQVERLNGLLDVPGLATLRVSLERAESITLTGHLSHQGSLFALSLKASREGSQILVDKTTDPITKLTRAETAIVLNDRHDWDESLVDISHYIVSSLCSQIPEWEGLEVLVSSGTAPSDCAPVKARALDEGDVIQLVTGIEIFTRHSGIREALASSLYAEVTEIQFSPNEMVTIVLRHDTRSKPFEICVPLNQLLPRLRG